MLSLALADLTPEMIAAEGDAMHQLVRVLFPLPRSITGSGLRATVRHLCDLLPLDVVEVASGTAVFDWRVPDEWSIADAYLEHESGRRFAEYSKSNLHVVAYSTPVDACMTLDELRPHLHSSPEHPDWIPYLTSFYSASWGFCLADRELRALPAGRYNVVIRSKLHPGSLTLAECRIAGESDEEMLVFAHDCHPSLANDNLSGLAVAAHVARFLRGRKTRCSYRFVFAPTTIGSITWLATNEASLGRIRHGLVLSLLGDRGPLRYKVSRDGGHPIDRAAKLVLAGMPGTKMLDFSPWGYDERQFCSPGINLPVGRLTRTPNGEFPEYHTSADNPDFLSSASLGEAWFAVLRILAAVEADVRYMNLSPRGEPQLGRRGLYEAIGGHRTSVSDLRMAMLWVLNQSDGRASLLDVAERSGLGLDVLVLAAGKLREAGLLAEYRSPES